MTRLNNNMKYFIILCTLASVLLTSKTLLAQEQMEPEWAAKPIQCMPLNVAFTKSRELGQYTSWGGLGKSNSVNHAGALDVFVFLNVNLENQTWTLLEVNEEQTDACVIGFGQSIEFDPETLNNLTEPQIKQ